MEWHDNSVYRDNETKAGLLDPEIYTSENVVATMQLVTQQQKLCFLCMYLVW